MLMIGLLLISVSALAAPSDTLCKDAVLQLSQANTEIAMLNQKNTQYYGEISNWLRSSYYYYAQGEGRTVYIPYGTFASLYNSSQSIYSNATTIGHNQQVLMNKLNDLTNILKNCVR